MPSKENPLIIQFEHNGVTTTHTITDAVTLVVQGEPLFMENTLQISASSKLTVNGLAPWNGLAVRVNIAQINVRANPNTKQDPVAIVKEGKELIVTHDTTESIGIVWRQILAPADLSGRWIADSVRGHDLIYLLPIEHYTGQEAPESPEIPATNFSAQAVTSKPETPDSAGSETDSVYPAPLTGRFKLVEKEGATGRYTALSIDGDDKPKLGVNIREFPHFGIPQWQWAREQGRASYCKSVQDLKMKWIRFFTPHITYKSLDENIARIRDTLDIIRDHNLVAVVTLTDSLADVGMFPKEDADWHEKGTPMGHYHKDYFNTNAFRKHYHPYVKAIVSAFKDHAGVGMWQLMNEPALYMPPANDTDVASFARWVDETSAMIYDLDTVHPISIGMINVSHIKPPTADLNQFALDFYSKRKHVHVVTCHSYQGITNGDANAPWDLEDSSMADIRAAAKTGRAMIWTEFGASQASNRRMSTERFLNRQLLQNHASAALQWGYMLDLDGISDSGVGDKHFGWSKASFNKEFDDLKRLFASYPAKV